MRVVFLTIFKRGQLLLIKYMRTKLNSLFIILLISFNFTHAIEVESSKGKSQVKDAAKTQKEAEKNAKDFEIEASSSIEKITPSNQNNSTTIKVLSLNPFYLFTVGFLENLGGQTSLITKCVPKEWLGESYQKSQISLEKIWQELNSSFQSVLTLSSKIITPICAAKSDFKTYVIGDKKSFIQKNMSLIRSRKGAPDFYSKAKEQYEKVKKSFISLFIDNNFHFIMDVLRCGTGAGVWNGQMTSNVVDIAKKVGYIQARLAAGGVGVEEPIADIFINIICNLQAFVLSTGSLVKPFQINDKHDIWVSFGRFFGSVAKIDALKGIQIVLRKPTLI
jgi:hypothetical protein